MSGPQGAPVDDDTGAENAPLIAAQAQSLRATFLRDRPPGDPVTYADLADVVELVELLATEMADLAERLAK